MGNTLNTDGVIVHYDVQEPGKLTRGGQRNIVTIRTPETVNYLSRRIVLFARRPIDFRRLLRLYAGIAVHYVLLNDNIMRTGIRKKNGMRTLNACSVLW